MCTIVVCANSYRPGVLFEFGNESSAPDLTFRIAIYEYSVCNIASFALAALFGGSAGCSRDFNRF